MSRKQTTTLRVAHDRIEHILSGVRCNGHVLVPVRQSDGFRFQVVRHHKVIYVLARALFDPLLAHLDGEPDGICRNACSECPRVEYMSQRAYKASVTAKRGMCYTCYHRLFVRPMKEVA